MGSLQYFKGTAKISFGVRRFDLHASGISQGRSTGKCLTETWNGRALIEARIRIWESNGGKIPEEMKKLGMDFLNIGKENRTYPPLEIAVRFSFIAWFASTPSPMGMGVMRGWWRIFSSERSELQR